MKTRNNRANRYIFKISYYIILTVLSLTMIFPFYWMVVTAMKTPEELSVYPPSLLPKSLNLSNFKRVLSETEFLTYFLNSLFCAVTNTILVVIVTVLSAYGFYRFSIKGKKYIIHLLMLTNAIPFEIVMILNYRMMISWNLYDNLWALIIPFICNFSFVYILYDAFCSIPKSLVYASIIDKSSHLKFIRHVAIPHAKTALIYIIIINIVGSWNSFVWPMMITNTSSSRTLPLGTYIYMPEYGSRTELVMAMSVFSEIPMALLFILFQKMFILKNDRASYAI